MPETTKTLTEAIADVLLKHPDWEVRITRHEINKDGTRRTQILDDQPPSWKIRLCDWDNYGYHETIITEECRTKAATDPLIHFLYRAQSAIEARAAERKLEMNGTK